MTFKDMDDEGGCNMVVVGGDFSEHQKVTVQIKGKEYTRVVKFRRDCGLYIIVNNRMYFEYEFEYQF